MTTFLVSFLLAFLCAVLLTPVMIRVARSANMVDAAGMSHRKIHAEDIPRLGGAAIVLAFYAPLAGLWLWRTRVGDATLAQPSLVAALMVGGLCIALLGLYDDLRNTSPKVKLIVQVLVALGVAWAGVRIGRINLPFLPVIDLGWFAVPITVLWIVGVTNAVNLIDGLDGLAAGIALFCLVPLVVLAVSKGNLVLALLCCSLAGAVLGFLVYNFHPARIFMGDTGSMFLGFVLSVVSITTAHKGRVTVAMLTPVLALGLPILDTLLALARRAWMGQSLFVGDRQHIHHRLMARGLSHRSTVLVMYGFAAVFATLGLLMHFRRDGESALLFLLSLVVAGVLLNRVGYLVLPTGDGSAAAIRERNRLVREATARGETELLTGVTVDQVARAAADLAFAAGAVHAELRVHHGAPVRTWAWSDTPVPADPHLQQRFALIDLSGTELGVLSLTWPSDGTFHDAVLPAVEVGVRKLAERLGTAPRATDTASGRAGA